MLLLQLKHTFTHSSFHLLVMWPTCLKLTSIQRYHPTSSSSLQLVKKMLTEEECFEMEFKKWNLKSTKLTYFLFSSKLLDLITEKVSMFRSLIKQIIDQKLSNDHWKDRSSLIILKIESNIILYLIIDQTKLSSFTRLI